MKPGRLLIAAVLVAGSLGWVAYRGLKGNLVYYRTPTEILQQGRSAVGERVRLGGLVMEGSVQRSGNTVRFVVTDETTRMTVIDTEGVPSLFREGKGVVLEGYYGADGAFHADAVMVKHNDRYSPPKPGETPHSANIGGG
jgi:cytochrome c-type biogenesis protein CcmE